MYPKVTQLSSCLICLRKDVREQPKKIVLISLIILFHGFAIVLYQVLLVTQFQLPDWFTVLRLPAIIPVFGFKWKLMRQTSHGINSLFLVGSQVSWTKKMDEREKNKFCELFTEEIKNQSAVMLMLTLLSFAMCLCIVQAHLRCKIFASEGQNVENENFFGK